MSNNNNTSLNDDQQNNTEKHFSYKFDYDLIFDQFKNDPPYYQCYVGILSALGKLSFKTADSYDISSYAVIYSTTKSAVDKVLESKNPEIDINTWMTKFLNNHHIDGHKGKKDISYNYGYIQGMVFLIVLYDSMQQKNESVIDILSQCRYYLELEASKFDILDGNPLWQLIAKRIPPKNEPSLEDIRLENEQLLKKVESLEENLKQKDEEINKLNQGMIKEENEFRPRSTEKKINILHSTLNLPNHLEGEERKQFMKLCKFMTKAEETTLARLLSQNSLQKMIENRENLIDEYPILKRK